MPTRPGRVLAQLLFILIFLFFLVLLVLTTSFQRRRRHANTCDRCFCFFPSFFLLLLFVVDKCWVRHFPTVQLLLFYYLNWFPGKPNLAVFRIILHNLDFPNENKKIEIFFFFFLLIPRTLENAFIVDPLMCVSNSIHFAGPASDWILPFLGETALSLSVWAPGWEALLFFCNRISDIALNKSFFHERDFPESELRVLMKRGKMEALHIFSFPDGHQFILHQESSC